jgi:microcystin synthetase protein McyJ
MDGIKRARQVARSLVTRFPRHIGTFFRQVLVGSTADYYTFVGTDPINFRGADYAPSRPLWLNTGYWKNARRYDDACAALAIYLGEVAQLAAGDEVLDVGCGFGEQDFLWLRTFAPRQIVALNITALHVEVARKRAAALGVADRIDFQLGSATNLKFAARSFDKIVALESAFHFRTREKFLAEAFRTLRPGGVLALTDMIPLPGQGRGGLVARLERRFGTFEDRNLYDRNAYADKLRAQGFIDISIESIRNDVYPGMAKFASASKSGTPAADIVVELSADDIASCRGHETWSAMGIGDYVMVRATKPPGPA